MSLPFEVLDLIFLCCPLPVRYRCSIVHRRFKFSQYDWQRFSKIYNLCSENRESLRSLLKREWAEQVSVSRRMNVLWSNHLRAPLMVWSPWTLQKCCRRTQQKLVLHFRQMNFINFVRKWSNIHRVRPACIQRLCLHQSVQTTIWLKYTKRMEMAIFKGKHKKIRFCLENTLKKLFCRARALLEFRISPDERLFLKVHKLEFLV